jgi:hypothetical protein
MHSLPTPPPAVKQNDVAQALSDNKLPPFPQMRQIKYFVKIHSDNHKNVLTAKHAADR